MKVAAFLTRRFDFILDKLYELIGPLIAVALLLFLAFMLSGCVGLEEYLTDNPGAVEQTTGIIQGVGAAAAPFTGGLSVLIAQIAGIALPSIVAINRAIVAHKRKKQTESIVKGIDAGKVNGLLNFNDVDTKKRVAAVMGSDAATAVAKIRGKQ